MGFFSSFRQSMQKSAFITDVTRRYAALSFDPTGDITAQFVKAAASAGQKDAIIQEIYGYIVADPVLSPVLSAFDGTEHDIKAIIAGMEAAGAGGDYRGHYAPISGVLFADTLAYLLRAQRGQVPEADAYFDVMMYWKTGARVFEPERKFHS